MKNFIITEEAISKLKMAFEKLSLIEVKGDSVEYLLASKILIRQSVESLTEIKEENKKEE